MGCRRVVRPAVKHLVRLRVLHELLGVRRLLPWRWWVVLRVFWLLRLPCKVFVFLFDLRFLLHFSSIVNVILVLYIASLSLVRVAVIKRGSRNEPVVTCHPTPLNLALTAPNLH